MSEQDRPKPSKRLAIASIIIAAIALAVAAGSLYVSREAVNVSREAVNVSREAVNVSREAVNVSREEVKIQFAAIKPIISLELTEASYDTTHIKIRYQITNLGTTTAELDRIRFILDKQRNVITYVDALQGKIIPPTKEPYRGSAYVSRLKDGRDLVETAKKRGRISVELYYRCRSVGGEVIKEVVAFSNIPWHDKSIIGVRPDS